MDQITLERDGKGPLQFVGYELSFVTTRTEHKPRWTELRLWAVEESDALWVVETIGRSTVEGETDRRDATACYTPEEVKACLSKRGGLTAPGYHLLQYACDEDDDIRDFFYESVRKVERL